MKRRRTAAEQTPTNDQRLLREWRAWHHGELEEALAGAHRGLFLQLTEHLGNLRSACELVQFIEAQDWSAIDAHTRLVALHQINKAICALRERLGQFPIDDALPGESLRAYQLIRNILNQFPAPTGEPTSGNG